MRLAGEMRDVGMELQPSGSGQRVAAIRGSPPRSFARAEF
jgi:hypothetical protein